jgi:OOP family OmpA-OmpF porin
MSIDAGHGPRRDGDAFDTPASAADDLARLRQLLLHDERAQLEGLARRLNDPDVRAAETSAVLPEAVRRAVARGPALSVTIAPVVEDAIHESVRRDPARLVNAIFPVMGPAIRRSIAATLRDMVQSLNQVLDSSVSWRGLMWRLEARRTGKPFAEIVLLHTLVYQVEQVFLVHARTGLLLQHVVATSAPSPDPHIVSGMLTAIQDFVNESFNAGVPGTLEAMHVGDRTIWIEPGSRAYLAGIVRGQAPMEFRSALQDALARIHAEHALLLERFEGQAAPFEACRPLLDACLQARYVDGRTGGVSRPLAVVLALVAILLGLWVFLSLRSSRRWDRFVDRLRAEPGVVLVTAERRAGGLHVAGLRDQLAADPDRLQTEAGYAPGEVTSRWDAYFAAEPAFVLPRATALLSPPSTARLAFDRGALTVQGTAPRAWIADTLRLARFVPGVTAVRADALRSQETVDAEALAAAVGRHAILFPAGSDRLDPGQRQAVAALAADVRAVVAAARAAAVDVTAEVIGGTDETGSETANTRLGARRAEAVVAALVSGGLDRRLFAITAGPSTDPSPDEGQRALKRRVHLRVYLIPSAGVGESGR